MNSTVSSERGAILIHVAVGSLVLMAFTMFVVDYGIMWVGRNQAQNAADGGALAGAVALAFDNSTDRTDDGPAKQSAWTVAQLNDVFGEDPDVNITTDVIFYPDDPSKFPAECEDDTCIRVDVYRNQARDNPLPMWFGQFVGLNVQGVRAAAIARAMNGNASECVKPWVVSDRWDERPSTPEVEYDQSQPFNVASDGEPDPLDAEFDSYVPPTFDDAGNFEAGTGYGRTDDDGNLVDYGYQFILRMANPGGGSDIGLRSPGWVLTIQLPNADAGGGEAEVTENISDCTDAIVAIAEPTDPCNEPSSLEPDENGQIILTCIQVQTGNALNPQLKALEEWIGGDLDDVWLPPSDECPKGCPNDTGSKRIIPLAIFDPAHYAASGANGSTGVVKVVNVLGFFVEGTCSGGTDIDPLTDFSHESYLACSDSGPANDLVGRLITIPGYQVAGAGNAGPSAFTQVVRLIR